MVSEEEMVDGRLPRAVRIGVLAGFISVVLVILGCVTFHCCRAEQTKPVYPDDEEEEHVYDNDVHLFRAED